MRMKKSYSRVIVLVVFWSVLHGSLNLASAGDQKVFVLVYHSFLGNSRYPSDISLQELTLQLDFLSKNGFHFVSFSDLLKGHLPGLKNILIALDDGNQSVYMVYKEVFKPLHIHPLLAIYPNIIGKKEYALTWEQLKYLSDEGCDIASHGYYHLLLNQKLFEEDKRAFLKEIYLSKQALEKRLNVKVTAFVYPNGVRSDITKKTVKDAGYRYAFTVVWGPVFCPLNENRNPYELPRYMVYQNNWAMISNSILKMP